MPGGGPLAFWLPFGGYLAIGFLATFGVETTTSKNKGKRRIFLLFAFAVAINQFLLPLLSDKLVGNALTVDESDAMSEADNFLGPLDQVFQFLEDGTTVRIAAAVGAGRATEAGDLIKLAIYAGLGSGAVAAAFIIPLAFIGPLFAFFVPYTSTAVVPAGCPAIGEAGTGLTDLARPYWILSAVTLPFTFATKCSLAFFLGSQSFVAWIVAGILAGGIGLALSYVFVVVNQAGTVGVGVVGLITSPLFVLFTVGFLVTPTMRAKYNFTRFRTSPGSSALLAQCAKDGFKLMLKDFLGSVASNLPSMFIAQVSAGLQYALGLIGNVSGRLNVFSAFLALSARLRGAALLGGGRNVEFRALANKLLIQGAICGLAGTVAALAGINSLPYGFASHTLLKLDNSTCTKPLYDQVFDNATGPTYWLMAATLFIGTMNTVYGSLLYAFRDFGLLLKLGALNFVVGMPLTILSFVSLRTLFAIYAASTVPGFISFVVYVWRFHFVLMKRLPMHDTDGEAALLPEHGADRDDDDKDSLLAMAEADIERLLLGRGRAQSWNPQRDGRPKSLGLRPVSAPYKLAPLDEGTGGYAAPSPIAEARESDGAGAGSGSGGGSGGGSGSGSGSGSGTAGPLVGPPASGSPGDGTGTDL